MLTSLTAILGVSSMVSGPAILLGLGVVFAIGLTIAKVRLHVEQDPRIEKVENALPGANCGGCGYAGCAAYAKAVVEGKAPVTGCTVGGPELAQGIANILGVKFEVQVKTRPVIHCSAHTNQRKGRKEYHGVQTCGGASLITGIQGCVYGCLGFSDCVKACKFGAMRMNDGLPEFDYSKCTSCGACVKACPRNLIELLPFKKEAMLVVGCSSRDPAKVVKQVCEVGCLGCGACSKRSDVFGVNGNLAKIDYDKFDDLESLAEACRKCPAAALVIFGPERKIPVKEAFAQPESLAEEIPEKGKAAPAKA
jgi:RnfABCDGE-type electron transport complex B subunit